MSGGPAYRDQLPEGCPPRDALAIPNGTVVFRLVASNTPDVRDFESLRAMKPEKVFPNLSCECRASALSVHDDINASRRILKLPKFQKHCIAQLSLGIGAGVMKAEGKQAHYEWWPFADFDILAVCRVVS